MCEINRAPLSTETGAKYDLRRRLVKVGEEVGGCMSSTERRQFVELRCTIAPFLSHADGERRAWWGGRSRRLGGSCWTFQFLRNQSNQSRGGYAALHILISSKAPHTPRQSPTSTYINCSGPQVPKHQPSTWGEPDDFAARTGGGTVGAKGAWVPVGFFFF